MRILCTFCSKSTEKQMASHVLQFLYLGFNRFWFPIAHFPTTQVKTSELHFLFWESIKMLNMYGF
jgi:hypothetical protein